MNYRLSDYSIDTVSGDPDSTYLRKIEKEVSIPDLMKKLVHEEKCLKEVEGEASKFKRNLDVVRLCFISVFSGARVCVCERERE